MNAWLESWSGLWLLEPRWLLLWLGLPLALLARRRSRPAAVDFAPLALYDAAAPRSWRERLRAPLVACEVLGLATAIFALARPVERVRTPREVPGLEILLCLDRSSSMRADDLEARRTRREVAIDAATRFIAARGDDRIGLLAFARYADLLCPPTRDHAALVGALRAVQPVEADGPEDATGIGAAIASAARRLSARPSAEQGRPSRLAILFTDGEENVALSGAEGEISPTAAAQLCAREGIKVYAIAAGSGRRGAEGQWIELDVRALEELARRTGGRAFRARRAADVDQIFRAIDRLERAELEAPEWRSLDRATPFLLAALALLLCAHGAPLVVRRVLP
ncbi:MAG: VWA domain-containing protein [Planctomycetes bacterium]|nr:VWA domain-containing protein [Planctomycetota bacterium]